MLEGNLKNLAFTDVLQVLATGQKSGVLTLTKAYFRARIYLDMGRLEVAHLTPGPHLGEMLVRMDLLTTLEVQELLTKQARDNPGTLLGLLAVREGFIEDEDLANALKHQVLEVLTELATWRSGTFHFAERSADASQVPVEHSFDTMMLLMEIIGRLDDWQKHTVASDAVFERAGDPTQVSLPEGGWEVLGHVSGKRNAASIASELDLPERQVFYILNQLTAFGIIRPVPFPPEEAPVLILSASQSLQRLIYLSLQRAGVTPYITADIVSGIDFTMTYHPKAVVVDNLYGEGWDFVRELRGLSGRSHLPAVVLSHEKRPSGFWSRFKRPEAYVVLKPYRELELQQLVAKLVGRPLS